MGVSRSRRSLIPVLLIAVGALLLTVVPAAAKGVPYLIEVESYDPKPVIDEPTEIVIALHDLASPDQPLETDLVEAPIELRQVDGNGWIRPDFERLDSISFRASLTYRLGGEWVLVTHPSYPDRGAIPSDYPSEMTVTVTGPPATTASGSWEGLAAVLGFGALLVILVVLVSRSRWRRGQPAAPDNPGDTWWSG